jgi:hypothetical protein
MGRSGSPVRCVAMSGGTPYWQGVKALLLPAVVVAVVVGLVSWLLWGLGSVAILGAAALISAAFLPGRTAPRGRA